MKPREVQPDYWKYELPGGFEALAGKTDADNDLLSLRVAAPNDLWFHVRGLPGSHVILRHPENEKPGNATIKQTAAIAAWHSKARNAGNRSRLLHRGQTRRQTARRQARKRNHQTRKNCKSASGAARKLIKLRRQLRLYQMAVQQFNVHRKRTVQRQRRKVINREKRRIENIVVQRAGLTCNFAQEHQLIAVKRPPVLMIMQIAVKYCRQLGAANLKSGLLA